MPPPVYRGHFGKPQAERLLWRAGFGPRPGEAERLARLGLDGAVRSLTHPKRERLRGPRPHDGDGRSLAPYDRWGHDQLWWLDRMVRTSRPLVERMALVWHDWFATSREGVDSARLMLRQNQLFRRQGLGGSFAELVAAVTADPAMLVWLSGTENTRWSPNENYARELMELFTLGAGRGYTERDVRQQARALTGWRNDWSRNLGPVRFRFDKERHDTGVKTIFGHRGRYDWRDSGRLCVHHRLHPSFFVTKLWSYFIPVPPKASTKRSLERLYVRSGHEIRPVVEAILRHPALYEGPRMVKPPVVYLAGLLRSLKRGVDTDSWTWLLSLAGQQLFYPPNVAGWDDTRWLDTATYRARWIIASYAIRPHVLDSGKAKLPYDANKLLHRAEAFLGEPSLTAHTHAELKHFAKRSLSDAHSSWKKEQYPALVENALRQLLASSPDLQTC